jgi:hypothetical protein
MGTTAVSALSCRPLWTFLEGDSARAGLFSPLALVPVPFSDAQAGLTGINTWGHILKNNLKISFVFLIAFGVAAILVFREFFR